ncbi:classical arabinogalactan protein 25 [Ricinus communis]|uniref:classical arabinogalactan protein 25 n=1 Tax=Ricinus communis TaxID=3988 RepID=UPI00201B1F50|nr:classical arabinogalactan protein 25 [Ricinus communis]
MPHTFSLRPKYFHYITTPTHILLSPLSATLISSIIRMASFWFLLSFIISLIILPLFSSSTLLNSQPSTIPTSPASLTNSNSLPLSPFQELSPDIAPLLPSPGGVLPSPTVSSLPTIPSTPSPPNPDDLAAAGPDSAFSPLGSLPASYATPQSLVNLAVAVGCTAYCSLRLFKM